MARELSHTAFAPCISPSRRTRSFTRILLVAWTAADECLERRRQRLALREMSEHMLRDIGLSRSQAYNEAAKPFWRE